MERFVGGYDVLESGNLRAEMRPGASGDEDRGRAHGLAIRLEAHRVRVFDHGAGLLQLDLVAFECRRIGGLEASDLSVLVGDQCGPGKDRLLDAPAVAGGVLKLLRKARSVDE